METIRNLVDSIGGQAPGRPQLWELDSQALRNERVTAGDKNVLVYFRIKEHLASPWKVQVFKITASVRNTLRYQGQQQNRSIMAIHESWLVVAGAPWHRGFERHRHPSFATNSLASPLCSCVLVLQGT